MGGGGRGGGGLADPTARPRVVLRFPSDPNDILLSGGLAGQEALVGRALVVDAPLGKGHVVLFANRPFWRWQTHGSFMLAFNAILNWNALGAGKWRTTIGVGRKRGRPGPSSSLSYQIFPRAAMGNVSRAVRPSTSSTLSIRFETTHA